MFDELIDLITLRTLLLMFDIFFFLFFFDSYSYFCSRRSEDK